MLTAIEQPWLIGIRHLDKRHVALRMAPSVSFTAYLATAILYGTVYNPQYDWVRVMTTYSIFQVPVVS